MPKSSSIYTRVEPELKEQVEQVLSKLGIPMANAINLFLHQVVLHSGIPFDVRVPQSTLPDPPAPTQEQPDVVARKDAPPQSAGKTLPTKKVKIKMQKPPGRK